MKTSKIIFAIAAMGAAIAANAATLSYSVIASEPQGRAEQVLAKGATDVDQGAFTLQSGVSVSYIKSVSVDDAKQAEGEPPVLNVEPGEVFSGFNLRMAKTANDSIFTFTVSDDELVSLTKFYLPGQKQYVELANQRLKNSIVERKLGVGEKAVILLSGSEPGKLAAAATGEQMLSAASAASRAIRVEVTRLD